MPDNAAQAVLMKVLQPGERLLWCDMPHQGYQLRPGDITLTIIGIIWGYVAFLLEYPDSPCGTSPSASWILKS